MFASMAKAAGSVVSGIMGGIAGKKKFKAKAAAAREQKKWVGKQRKNMVENAFFNKQNINQAGESLLGNQETQIAGRGVAVGGETSYAVKQNTKKITSRNVEAKLRERDWDIKVSMRQEAQLEAQAKAFDNAASQSMINGIVSAATGGMVSMAGEFDEGGSFYKE